MITLRRKIFNWATSHLSDEYYYQLIYLIKHGKIPNISNPITFNEKVLWRMVHDKKDIYSQLTDKVQMREYVAKAGLEKLLPEAYYIGNHPRKIPFDKLPDAFVVKPNHLSGHIIFVDSHHPVNEGEIIKTSNAWLNANYYKRGRETPYRNIDPKIIVEQHLGHNATLPVYKFYCFRGKTKFILVGKGYFTREKKNAAYDAKWQKLEIAAPQEALHDFPQPPQLADMLKISSKLSNSFDFIRVDLYNVNGKIYFGEFTLTPAAGADKYLGKQNGVLGQFWQI